MVRSSGRKQFGWSEKLLVDLVRSGAARQVAGDIGKLSGCRFEKLEVIVFYISTSCVNHLQSSSLQTFQARRRTRGTERLLFVCDWRVCGAGELATKALEQFEKTFFEAQNSTKNESS